MSVLATTLLSLFSLTGALHLGTNLTLGAGTAICTSTLTNTHEKCCASGMFSVDPTSGDVVYHKYVSFLHAYIAVTMITTTMISKIT